MIKIQSISDDMTWRRDKLMNNLKSANRKLYESRVNKMVKMLTYKFEL